MKNRFWLTGALVLLCALLLTAANYYGITIPAGETFDATTAAHSKPVPAVTSDPVSGQVANEVILNTTVPTLKFWNGSAWTSLGGSVSGGTWTGVTYQNSFRDQGSGWQTVQYAKDAMGFVHLRGMATSADIGSISSPPKTIFTLPAGFRPPADTSFNISNFSNSTFHLIKIDTSGVVALQTSTVGATFFVFDGLNFSVN